MTVLGQVTQMPPEPFGAMTGRQVSILALFVPFALVGIVDGWKGVRAVWPPRWRAGSPSASSSRRLQLHQLQLCDIFASLASAAAIIGLTKIWRRTERLPPWRQLATSDRTPRQSPAETGPGGSDTGGQPTTDDERAEDTRRDVMLAFTPYAAVVVLFTSPTTRIKTALTCRRSPSDWPGLHILSPAGKTVSVAYKFNWLSATGTLLLFAGIITAIVLQIRPWVAVRTYGETLRQFGWAIVTVLLVSDVLRDEPVRPDRHPGIWLAQTDRCSPSWPR